MQTHRTKTTCFALIIALALTAFPCSAASDQAQQILDAAGVKGGLIIHIGCGDGKLTTALRRNDSFIVHGLDTDVKNVQAAREHIASQKSWAKVSVDRLQGNSLPYIDNLANLVVSDKLGKVSMDEVMRILAPKGVAYIKKGAKWTKTIKPRPKDIDEWTHYLHDSTGNAVSHDLVVGPPAHFQWIGSPRWARHHDRMASMSALVSANGRLFYIFDEATAAVIQLPQKRTLIARDAFNGAILWKRPIPSWHTHLWPFKSGPAQLPRRIIAQGDRVHVALGYEAPLTTLDAVTGAIIKTYPETKFTEEVIASDGELFLLVNPEHKTHNEYRPQVNNIGQAKTRVAEEWPWNEQPRRIMAIRDKTGNTLWSKEYRVVPLSLTADNEHVLFHDGERVVCLDRKNGDPIWRSDKVTTRSPIPTNFGPTLVAYDDIVLFAGGDRSMTALSAKTGKTLWTGEHRKGGHNSPEDLLVVGGLVWSGTIASGKDSGIFTGRDLHTGQVKSEFGPDVQTHWFHHRCYRAKATDRFLLPSRTGIEFIDYNAKTWTPHHWVRGGCLYGIMPANGLIYAPPHSCACYMDAKLNGFNALAPATPARTKATKVARARRLEQGPAFSRKIDASPAKNDWPTYRSNPSRNGFTKASVPAKLQQLWKKDLGGKLSSLSVAAGKLFVASIDKHTVHALDADNGKALWSYATGGRVDSPPTIYQGRVLFGSADGFVYCLDASDGALIWRFRAAPQDRRMMSFEQIESVWPVHGSVLVQNGTVYCLAGRSMFLDGGIHLLQLDPKTGRKISEIVLDDRDPETGENLQIHVKTLNMPTALTDVLSSDGKYLYMRTQRFDLEGNRQQIPPIDVSDQQGEGVHLFCNTGFLDDSWVHRSYWIYGRAIASGAGGWPKAGNRVPAGRILTVDDSSVYGYGRRPEYYKWTTPMEYHLFSSNKELEVIKPPAPRPAAKPGAKTTPRQRQQQLQLQRKRRKAAANRSTTKPVYNWSRAVPLHVRALVAADKTLFIAGPPDLIDEEQIFAAPDAEGVKEKLEEQTEAFQGKKGAMLWAVSASNGEKLADYKLDSPPVFDGMAAAAGRLYIATMNGSLVCMGPKN